MPIVTQALILALSILFLTACSNSSDDPVQTSEQPRELAVNTTEGEVLGVEDDGLYIYRGIPYAEPPVGALRWQPPKMAQSRNDSLLADKLGNPCVQTLPIVGPIGDEDCLVLNIVTPTEGDKLPVLLWIHGGGFILGEGAQTDSGTLGDKLAKQTNSVVVSINYRLGPFGFLAHSALSAESPYGSSGNYGLMDQILAMEWVRENIEVFGGDPDNVTLFGESAGAFSVCTHMNTALSAGLFHKAIVQSGSCLRAWPELASAEKQGAVLAEKLGCGDTPNTLGCMRASGSADVLLAFPAGANFGFADLQRSGATWWPILDGHVLTSQTADNLASGNFNKVPVIYGFNRDEAQLFTWLTEADPLNPLPITADNYADFATHLLGDKPTLVAQALTQYDPALYQAYAQALGALSSDSTFRCPARQELALLAEHVDTYLYQFDYTGAAFQLDGLGYTRPEYGIGAFHSAEIQYVFGNPATLTSTEFETEPDRGLWQTMMGYWARFAATGDPNGDGAAQWPLWRVGGDQHMAFNATSAASSEAAKADCEFWLDKDYLDTQFFQ